MKILRTASLGSNFTGSYKKKSVFTEMFQRIITLIFEIKSNENVKLIQCLG